MKNCSFSQQFHDPTHFPHFCTSFCWSHLICQKTGQECMCREFQIIFHSQAGQALHATLLLLSWWIFLFKVECERLLKVYQSGHPSIGHKSFSISKHNLPLQATGCRKEKRKVTMGIVKFIKHELEEAEITKKTSDPCIARPPTKVNRRRTILP